MQVKPDVDWVQLCFDENDASFDLELPAISVSFFVLTAAEQAGWMATSLPSAS